MKKSLIALAVAGAFAAPSVMAIEFTPTMYQSVALSIGSNESTTAAGVTTTDGSNGGGDIAEAPDGTSLTGGGGRSIGFKATDDLGNGMTATLFVHWTTDVTTGHQTSVVHRNGYVGLSSDSFGSVKLGTGELVYEVGMIIDGWGSDWAGGNSVGGWDGSPTRIGGAGTGGGFNWTRQDINAVTWTSPNWGGVTVDAALILGPGPSGGATSQDAQGTQLAVMWANGPLSIQGALASYSDYEIQSNDLGDFTGSTSAASAATATDADAFRITAQYDFGVVKIGGTYSMLEQEMPAVGGKIEVDTLAFTAIMPVATGRVLFNIVDAGDQDVTLAGVGSATVSDSGASGFDIGYQHDLSPNTYAFARYQQNERGLNYDNSGTSGESDAIMVGLKVSY